MIIFDLDGTLINSEYFLKKIEAELRCEMVHHITVNEQIKKFGGIGPHQQLEMGSSLPKEFADIAKQRFRPPQQNLWVIGGSGNFPRL